MKWRAKKRSANARPSVLVLTQFHPPEPCAAANRVAALTEALGDAGMRIETLTGFPSFPSGTLAAGDRILLRRTKLGERSRLTRVFTYASTRLSGRNRILNWLSVAVASALYVAVCRRYDFVLVTTPPITLALPAFVARLRGAKLVVDVRDVFPDVAVKMGYWRADSPVARTVGWVASRLYRGAELVLCVTESARAEIVARGSDPGKTFVAANGFDPLDVAQASPYDVVPGEFVAAFVGNMGLATGLDVVLEAAELLQRDARITFVLAGGGADRERLAASIAERRLTNVKMLGVVTRRFANALIANADVSIVPLHPAIVDSLPTKIFDALVLGCPVICCANGEARTLVERSGGGVAVRPGDGRALAEAVRELSLHPERRAGYAEAGRAYVERHFDRARIMRDVAARLLAHRT